MGSTTHQAADDVPFTPLAPHRYWLAVVVDGVLAGALGLAALLLERRLAGAAGVSPGLLVAVGGGVISAWLLVCWGVRQATPALAVLGGRIVTVASGEPPGWGHWARRLLGVALLVASLGLAGGVARLRGARRGLPDRLAGTRVEARPPPAPRTRRWAPRVALLWLGAALFAVSGALVVIAGFQALTEGLVLRTRTAAQFPDDARFARLCPPADAAGEANGPGVDAAARAAAQGKLAAADSRLVDYAGVTSRLESARNLLDSAVAIDPCYAALYVGYSRYFLRQATGTETPAALARARTAVARAIALEPDYAPAYVVAGFVALRQGELGASAAYLDTAERLGSTDPWLLNNRALLHEAHGDYEAAAVLYHQVSTAKDMERHARRFALDGLGQYYRRIGAVDRARQVIGARIDAIPDDGEGYAKQAELLLCETGEITAALAAAQRANELQNSLRTTGLLAQVYVARWAEQLLADNRQLRREAQRSLTLAQRLHPVPPPEMVAGACPGARLATRVAAAWAKHQADQAALAARRAQARQAKRPDAAGG